MKYKRGLVFGSFDPLHYGHIRLIRRAKEQCNELFIVCESDYIIEQEKKRKVFCNINERLEDLKDIKYVKDVGVRTIKRDRKYWANFFKADVLFVGDDHKGNWVEGEKLGVTIVYLARTKDISSTLLRL